MVNKNTFLKDTISDHKTARGFTSRQYSDIFSLFFGDEEAENTTTSWDYETETEAISSEANSTNEKGLLDAIKYSLNYVDGNKQNAEKQTNTPNQTDSTVLNSSSLNISYNDENDNDDGDEDEEEISILDFLLKGESAFTSSTPKPFVFNITGRPLLNGMTNSPMQVQPILPDEMKNESLKFSMLPMSLYNMVKDDGILMFDVNKTNYTVSPKPFEINTTEVMKNAAVSLSTNINHIPTSTTSTTTTTITTTTKSLKPMTSAKQTTTLKNFVESTTAAFKSKKHSQSAELNGMKNSFVQNTEKFNKTHSTVLTTPTMASTLKPSKSPVLNNDASVKTLTTEKTFQTTSLPKNMTISSKTNQSSKENIRTTKPSLVTSTTASLRPLTTEIPQTTTALSKTTAIQVSSSSNPSILETDLNYDYGEVPPSLPNLKIIPFLPTDAVKNIIHKSDVYKPIYYQSNPNAYVESPAYSPFNLKPTAEKYPAYNANIADDRIDYDSYKIPVDHVDNLDYINVYAPNGGNMIQPASFQLNVNSKIDYSSDGQKIVPPKLSANKNLTVKPPLPPFEPEHEYDFYNLPPHPQLQIQPDNTNEYGVDSPLSNEPYSPEHNYNVPHFVTMPPLNKPLNNNSVFSYSNKNKFIPPAKTEGEQLNTNLIKIYLNYCIFFPTGGFIPKRNHIPLHGTNNVDGKFPLQNLIKKQSEQEDISNDNVHNSLNHSLEIENNVAFNNFHEALLREDETASTASVSFSKISSESVRATTPLTTHASTSKPVANNLTNNAIPLKLITILNNTKKENPTKVEIPQRKNNKIIDPTDEPLVEDTKIPSATTEMAPLTKTEADNSDSLTILRDVFFSSLNHTPNGDISTDLPHKPTLFLSRPINKLNFPSFNSLESKHNVQANPIRSDLDLNYQVLPADDTSIANTESYVINPIDKLKQHQSNGETKIFTPSHNKDPAGFLKLAACNIYGVMYRVGRIIAELSTSCLECRYAYIFIFFLPTDYIIIRSFFLYSGVLKLAFLAHR